LRREEKEKNVDKRRRRKMRDKRGLVNY